MSMLDTIRTLPWRELPFTDVFTRSKRPLLSGHERQMCYWLAREGYSGEGAIVDLGSFLGSSTVAFAAGLRDRIHPAGHVHAYDLFRVSRDEETQRILNKKEGDSFLEEFKATIEGYEDLVTIHAGDIKQFPWSGEPIEILFVDLAKSWEMNEFIIKAFYPYLIPGKSILIHQDFGNGWNPWLPVSMGYLEAYFPFICDECPSRLFHCKEALPPEMLSLDYKNGLDRTTRMDCMQRSLMTSSGMMLTKMHGAMAILTFIEDGKEAGIDCVDALLSRLDLSREERDFLLNVRSTIDFWNHGWAYEREMTTKF